MTDLHVDLLHGLNKEQQQAVTTTEGPVLVVAGPGSGKTRVLTNRIAYLIQELDVQPDRILAVTFTNKAAREMRDRIGKLVGHQASGSLVMGTFHSLGVRFLRQNPGLVADKLGLMPNFLIYDDGDQGDLVKGALKTANLDPKQYAPRRMLSRISAAKSQLLGPAEFEAQIETYDDEVVARVFREYERALRKANAVDFDDLLVLPIRLFDAAPGLLERYQERFQYILVDEYQDTNRVQYVLVTALSDRYRNLFVVGDPDQSIYGWRQADIRNILDFEQDYPDAKQIHLELNYRSTKRIVEAADKVISANTQRIERRLRTENPDGEPVAIRELSDQNHEAQFVVSEIRRLMRAQGITPDQCAVMYRTTAQSRVIEEAFRTSDIPYKIVGGVRFYERKEVKDIIAILRLLMNPSDEISLDRVISNLPIGRGLGPKAVDTVRTWSVLNGEPILNGFIRVAVNEQPGAAPELSGAARTAAKSLGQVFNSLRSLAEEEALVDLFDSILEKFGIKELFNTAIEEEAQRLSNVLELRSDLGKYDALPPGDALPAYLEQIALVADVDSLEDDERSFVTLITLHSAKGLEYPVVFITGVEEGLLPISRAVEAEQTDPMPLEEERRLFYVGITRAQQRLYVTYTAMRMSYGRTSAAIPSRFLQALPRDRVRNLGMRESTRSSYTNRQSAFASGSVRTSSSYSAPATAPPSAAPPRRTYAVGERVFHAKFGEGTITAIAAKTDDQELTIEFIRHGRKLLLASFAPLDVLND
jgi:DNA helicase-2/ATP-dependent DNA helicase PcrA